jgi:dihydrodipicolinate synthase/N-acetylneuraminate lyase
MLCVGAVGVVSVASHLVGLQLKKMIELFHKGEVSSALVIHENLQPFFKSLFMTTNPIPIKAALELSGWNVGNPRSPLSPLPMDMKKQLSIILKSLLHLQSIKKLMQHSKSISRFTHYKSSVYQTPYISTYMFDTLV